MMDFDCREIEPELAAYHFGELPVERLGLVEAHVDDCIHCRAFLRDMQEVARTFRNGLTTDDSMHSVTLTSDRRDEVLAMAAAIDSGEMTADSVDVAAAAVLEWAGGREDSAPAALGQPAVAVFPYQQVLLSAAAGVCIASLIWAAVVVPSVQSGSEIAVSAPLPGAVAEAGDSVADAVGTAIEVITTAELAEQRDALEVLTAADTSAVRVVEIVVLPESKKPVRDNVRPVAVRPPAHKAKPAAQPVVEPAPTVAPTLEVRDPVAAGAGFIEVITTSGAAEVKELTTPVERRKAKLEADRAAAAAELGAGRVEPLDLSGFERFERPVEIVAPPTRITKRPPAVAPVQIPGADITIEVEREKPVPRAKPQPGVGRTMPSAQPPTVLDKDGNPVRVSVSIDVEDSLSEGMVAAVASGTEYAAPRRRTFVDTADIAQVQSLPVAPVDSMADISTALRDGRLPAPGKVRVAEFISAFDYSYPQPSEDQDLNIVTDLMPSLADDKRVLRIGIQPNREESKCVVGVAFNQQYVTAYRQIGEAGRHVAGADAAVTLLFELQLADDTPAVAPLVEVRARIADGGKAPTYARSVTSRFSAETFEQAAHDAQLAVIGGSIAEAFRNGDSRQVGEMLRQLRRLAAAAPADQAVRAMVRLFQ
jgi:hypothetical protein